MWSVKSECGPVRKKNEDSVFPDVSGSGFVPFKAGVFDGMGGHKKGEVASELASSVMKEDYKDLVTYVEKANKAIYEYQESNKDSEGMGTTMTAVENVALPLELAGVVSAFEKAEAMLEEVGLSHRLTHYPAQMSGGEQQRTALARALVANPPVLFADEPTGNLDQNIGRQIMDLILRLAEERSTTVLLITHDRVLADRCARVETMQDGQLLSARDKAS